MANIFKAKTLVGRTGLFSHEVIAPNLVYNTGNQIIYGDKSFYSDTNTLISGNFQIIPDYNLNGDPESFVNILSKNVYVDNEYIYFTDDYNTGTKYIIANLTTTPKLEFFDFSGYGDPGIYLYTKNYDNGVNPISVYNSSVNLNQGNISIYSGNINLRSGIISWNPYLNQLIPPSSGPLYTTNLYPISPFTLKSDAYAFIVASGTGIFKELYADNLVYNTGNQTVLGNKTFVNNIEVQGTGIFNSVDLSNISEFQFSGVTMNLVDTNTYVSGGWIYISGNPVLTGSQSISTINLNNIVYTTGNQTIEGIKDFNNIINVSGIKFDILTTTQTPVHQEGLLYYSDDTKTLNLDVDVAGLSLPIGQENWLRAKNLTNSTITPGTVVYINGAQGNTPLVERSIATGDSTSARTVAIAAHSISNNSKGYFTTFGIVEGINTSAYSVGQALYLSPQVSGGLTGVKPQAPNHAVRIGEVLDQGNNGSVFVNIQNGFEIEELHDVRIINQQNKDGIVYNSASGLWLNTPVALANEVVYLTGNQNISGDKNFLDKLIAKTGFFGENNNLVGSFSAMAGGTNNIVSGNYNFLGGGDSNIINNSCFSVIGGGIFNCINPGSNCTFIGGGRGNYISGCATTIGGGFQNFANAYNTTIGGGSLNFIIENGCDSFIGGGRGNLIRQQTSVIGGGLVNCASGCYSFIGGGTLNCTFGDWTSIVGGQNNRVLFYSSTIGGGESNIVSGCFSNIQGGCSNSINARNSNIGGGISNRILGVASNIGGGEFNIASGAYSFIGGGTINRAFGDYSASIGGCCNSALGLFNFIGAGRGNCSNRGYSSTVGGHFNCAIGDYNFVGGGENNCAVIGSAASVVGGNFNCATGTLSFVGGGLLNRARGCYSSTIGGFNNTTECLAFESTIGGGRGGTICAASSFIGAGVTNIIGAGACAGFIGGGSANLLGGNNVGGYMATIGGGSANQASGERSAILGGQSNFAFGECSAIIGGQSNINCGRSSIIGGGSNNFILGPSNSSINSFIGGGANNRIYRDGSSILGGQSNIVSGIYSATLGGFGNEIYSEYSFAIGGRRSCVLRNHDGAAILGDGQNRAHTSSGCHSLVIDFASGVYFAQPNIYGAVQFTSEINAPNLVYTTGDQTINGNKNFNGDINLTGTNNRIGKSDYIVTDGDFVFIKKVDNTPVLSSEECALFDLAGQNSISWNDRLLKDTTTLQALDWEYRSLNNENGVPVLYWTGDDITFVNRPKVNGTGVLLSGEGGGTTVLPDTIVYTSGAQTISGNKTFSQTGEFQAIKLNKNRFLSYDYETGNFNFLDYITIVNSTLSGSDDFVTGILPIGNPAGNISGFNFLLKNINTCPVLITGSGNYTIDGESNLYVYKGESVELLGVQAVGITGWYTLNTNLGVM